MGTRKPIQGQFTIEMHPEWAPIGAERFLALVKDGAYDGAVIYRVVRRGKKRQIPEAVQFGFIKDVALRHKWSSRPSIQDDSQIFANPNFHRGMISFAGGGPNTRAIDVFITFMTGNANGTPRAPWETPFGIIDKNGLRTIEKFGGTGDIRMLGGDAPDLGKGYEALKISHPNIDYLGNCTLVPAHQSTPPPASDKPGLEQLGSIFAWRFPMISSHTNSFVLLSVLGILSAVGACFGASKIYNMCRFEKVHGV